MAENRIDFLYTNIGRGHPFYLDGIIEAMVRQGNIKLVRGETDVFELSGGVSRFGWQIGRWLYRRGSSEGVIGQTYRLLRRDQDYSRRRLILYLLGQGIRRKYMDTTSPLIVAHPSLVAMLSGRDNLIYQHGEPTAPGEALVSGAAVIFVPTDQVASCFHAKGIPSEQVIITGLCIEPSLVKQAVESFELRMTRVKSAESLSGAFFSSGAEPSAHLRKIASGALSVVRAGHRALVFARRHGRLERIIKTEFHRNQIDLLVISSHDAIPRECPPASLIVFGSRREETSFTSLLFPSFDFVVAPSHERSNWALGLGLPMFVLTPTFGPFAPLNRQLLLERGVACDIGSDLEAGELGMSVSSLRRNGRLCAMAQAGWGQCEISGFSYIARLLSEKYSG